jgi:hypothetical protein
MSSLTVSTTIARSPADVYELLDDLANHEQFTDHFLVDWHMTREDTRGVGAGVRLRATVGSHRDAEITSSILPFANRRDRPRRQGHAIPHTPHLHARALRR